MASTTILAPSQVAGSSSPSFTADSRRQSYISSSAASFQTARTESMGPGSRSSLSSRSSSAHTLGPREETSISNPYPSSSPSGINPLHTMSQQQRPQINGVGGMGSRQEEVHIVKVTGDTVHLESGPMTDTFMQKVGHSISKVVPTLHSHATESPPTHTFGPPPPSPPASVEQTNLEEEPQVYNRHSPPMSAPKMRSSKTEPFGAGVGGKPITFDEPLSIYRDTRKTSTDSSNSRTNTRNPTRQQTLPDSLHRSSTETRLSTSTHGRPSDDSYSGYGLADTSITTPEASSSKTPASISYQSSPDGHLQPPGPMNVHRPTRRNTTGSVPRPSTSSFGRGDDDGERELESDIQMQAEAIRRERHSKKAKAREVEAQLTSQRGGVENDNQVLVGNLIGEDHVNYVLMYNMLTGIRIAVSRCQAKTPRRLVDEDFTAKHKFSFDITGNELTPSAKYDFKFKDYAPWVFRELREEYFHLDPADYLLSLTAKYILSELGSPGKSGSFFYFSRDYRFIIKTIRHSEAKFLLSVLKDYHAHVKNNPHTLISRFYGLHRVKLPRGRKIHFVIMNNLFPPHRDIHETFDLKGSTVGRVYPEELAAQKPRAVLKDLNWINRGRSLDIGPEKRALMTEQLRRDSDFLKRIDVMDYSLLVGIHNMQRGNKDNVRRNTLKVFSPDVPRMRRKPTALKGSKSPEAIAMRRAMRESDPKRLGAETIALPEEDTGDRQSLIFYQDEGGLRATDEANDPMDTIYYLGVIDILTPYSFVKKLEHFWKGMSADRHKISPVEPSEYGDRFFSFMKAIMRGGGGGERFKPDS